MNTHLARDLFEAWNRALEWGDPESVADCYAADAVLVPTLSACLRSDRAGIVDYFKHFLQYKLHAAITEDHVHAVTGMLVHSGHYRFSDIAPGATEHHDVDARFTFVYRCDNGAWKIIAHHSSLLPTSENQGRHGAEVSAGQ